MLIFTNLLTTVNDPQYHLHLLTMNDKSLLKDMIGCLKSHDVNLIIEVLQALEPLFNLDEFVPLLGEE